MKDSLYKFVNSRKFTYSWFAISFLSLFITSFLSYKTLTLLFLLTFIDSLSDIFLEHWYSLGISRRLTYYNCLANLLGIIVQFCYGLYGGAVTSFIGFVLLAHKTYTWDIEKDGKISHLKRTEVTITTIAIFLGIVALGVLYGIVFVGNQPAWLVALNILVFILGVTGRILLINGKAISQQIYIVREFIDFSIFISMVTLGLTTESFWIRLSSIISSFIILWKGLINWSYEADKNK